MDIAGDRTLYSIFRSYAELQPDYPWLRFESATGQVSEWTYANFLREIHKTANLLYQFGIRNGDVINLHLAR